MKLHKFRKIIIEGSIWLVLLVFFTVLTVHLVDEKFINKPQHIIKFKDVNGLIVGSPVYYAGVNIGHVSDINLVQNEAVVTFKVDRKDVILPKGTYANIEFKGLAGSKSIELFRTPVSNDEIISTETIRFSTVLEAYSNFMETIISISDFVMVGIKEIDKDDAKIILESTRDTLIDVNTITKTINKGLEKTTFGFAQKLSRARKTMAEFFAFKPSENLEVDFEAISKSIEEFNEKLPLSARVKHFIKDLAGKMTRARKEVCEFTLEDKEKIKTNLDIIDDVNCFIHKFSKSAKSKYNKKSIESIKCKVEEFKQKAIEMNKRMQDGNRN